ncbi:MAG: metal ABC transporter permease [Rickettsiaceae bacterium]|nr:metal ABC transporter permease [Rickettsiaceae bacterium]
MIIIFAISTLIGLIFAPLGCFVLWKRYVYFGDGLAHASMLAAVISVILGVPIFYAGIINTLLFALIVFKLKGKSGNNAAIGLTSSVMISFALVLSYIFPYYFNFTRLLFGDIIATNATDAMNLCIILAAIVMFFTYNYRNLLLVILSKDVATTRGVNVKLLDFMFLSILSFSVLITIKIVGALLVTSIILVPAMIARLMSSSPLRMIALSTFMAQLMNVVGISLSFYLDLPLAPIIILSGGILYAICAVVQYCRALK